MTETTSRFVRLDEENPARQARRMVRDVCRSWPQAQVEDAELMVTEMVANALDHGRGDVRVAIIGGDHRVRVAVSDDGSTRPELSSAPPSAEDESGRGLRIIDTLAHSWGTETGELEMGTTVWFALHRD